MCTNTPSFSAQDSAQYRLKGQVEKLERYLRGARVYGKNADRADYVSLTGGEPTLHPEFFQLVNYFRRRLPGTPITLLSNGRRFADRHFASRFAAAARPPFAAALALHGPGPRVHDAVAGVRGAFTQTVRGIKNLLELAPELGLEIRIVLHGKSVSAFPKTLAFLLKEFPGTSRYSVSVIHYEIEGMSKLNHRLVGLRLSDSVAALRSAGALPGRFRDLRLYHFPVCLVPAALRSRCRVTLPREERIYPPVCRGCAARRKCLGLMLEYYKRFGDAELRPVKR
jgi:pyruvate-formate lyase-activating enzyme